jgi:hypothetical protein
MVGHVKSWRFSIVPSLEVENKLFASDMEERTEVERGLDLSRAKGGRSK